MADDIGSWWWWEVCVKRFCYTSGMKFLVGIIITIFLGIMFLSLFPMLGTVTASHQMSGANDCPFMTGQEVLCAMNLNEHIGAWKAVFATALPAVFTLFLVLSVAVLIAATAPHLLRKPTFYRIPIQPYLLSYDRYSHSIRQFQELFASGILHPKLF